MHRFLPLVASLAVGAASAAPCEAPEWRQFDFWLGEWTVFGPAGKVAGTNVITREYGGCVVHERYTTERGYAGESLNAWDVDRKVWHQTWVDNAGTLLLLEGRLEGSAMVLQGAGVDEGRPVKHRITWTPNADGTVRQHWETAVPDGAWKTAFDGLYRRKP
ncbi:DUF1579 family protein [Ramlibacter sp. PS4R-6]|uniref:DUF1579 family protein n=1 Tax=Ramlibacter sp. PS4R-6 TaxID=3133438 RepID=UPI0030AFA74E